MLPANGNFNIQNKVLNSYKNAFSFDTLFRKQKIMANFDITQEIVGKAHEYIFSKLIF